MESFNISYIEREESCDSHQRDDMKNERYILLNFMGRYGSLGDGKKKSKQEYGF